jgi:hypothetical protein
MESSLLDHDEFLLSSTTPRGAANASSTTTTSTNISTTNNQSNATQDSSNSGRRSRSNRTRTGRTYPIVEVVAPESLSEGYTFDVEVNHEILSVVVVSF